MQEVFLLRGCTDRHFTGTNIVGQQIKEIIVAFFVIVRTCVVTKQPLKKSATFANTLAKIYFKINYMNKETNFRL